MIKNCIPAGSDEGQALGKSDALQGVRVLLSEADWYFFLTNQRIIQIFFNTSNNKVINRVVIKVWC
ncbi:hypothetical protein QCD60_22280 [Pokkaliibacter sp. MBI-7]|uniref:hypothetical protein n=1 Tax=Pokkaliibacter sp. MBI-7 TaxID=3040600 RepID=UPI00244B5A8F|nr:hypothetical protein [Pokkaliibacter sp. MBI-7]MDH2435257.1 hypothetical protein [Pokkaliibacter sp. MBI-7]